MQNAVLDPPAGAEPTLSRLELWFGVIATYLILIAFLFGYFGSQAHSADDMVVPSNRYA